MTACQGYGHSYKTWNAIDTDLHRHHMSRSGSRRHYGDWVSALRLTATHHEAYAIGDNGGFLAARSSATRQIFPEFDQTLRAGYHVHIAMLERDPGEPAMYR